MVFQKSMIDWGSICQIWAQCAFCYTWNLFGVMVSRDLCLIGGGPSAKYEHNVHSAIYETYLVSWFSRNLCSIGGSNMSTMCILLYRKLIWCHGFPEIYAQLGGPNMSTMCILLYRKLIWCHGFPEIYAQLGGQYEHNVHSAIYETYLVSWFSRNLWSIGVSICQIWAQCAFCYIGNLFGVMVFQKSMIDWGVHLPNMSTMCILLYMKLIWCHGFPEIYAQLGGQIWAQCAFCLYMKLIWCHGFPEIYAQLGGPNMSTMCILLYMKLIWCHGFPEIYAQLGGPNMSTMCILLYRKLIWWHGFPEIYAQLGGQIWAQCAFCYIGNLFGVMDFQKSMLKWGGQIWAQCAFCYIGNLFGVMDFQKSMLNWGANMSTMCILLYMKLIWCHGFPEIYARLEGVHWPNMSTMCILLYRKLIGVMVFQKSMLNWGAKYEQMCILLYRKLIWCHGFPEIYDRLGCPSAKYEHNVHSAIHETYLV